MKVEPWLAAGLILNIAAPRLRSALDSDVLYVAACISVYCVVYLLHNYRNAHLSIQVNLPGKEVRTLPEHCSYCNVRLRSLGHGRCSIFSKNAASMLHKMRINMENDGIKWIDAANTKDLN